MAVFYDGADLLDILEAVGEDWELPGAVTITAWYLEPSDDELDVRHVQPRLRGRLADLAPLNLDDMVTRVADGQAYRVRDRIPDGLTDAYEDLVLEIVPEP